MVEVRLQRDDRTSEQMLLVFMEPSKGDMQKVLINQCIGEITKFS